MKSGKTENKTGKRFYSHYKKLEKEFETTVDSLRKKTTKGKIHDLRVAVKQLRSFLSLAPMTSTLRKKTEIVLNRIKPLYKRAGNLRQVQLMLDELPNGKQSKNGIDIFQKHLQKTASSHKKKFKKTINKYDYSFLKSFRKTIKNISARNNEEKIVTTANRFIGHQKGAIKMLMKHKNNVEAMHAERKHLKNISAALIARQKILKDRQLTQKIRSIKHSENIIGKWHDVEILASSVKKFLNEQQNGSDLSSLKKFEKTERTKSKKLQGSVNKELKQLFAA